MQFSSPTKSSLGHDVARFGDGLRRSNDFQNLDDTIRGATDTTISEMAGAAARLDAQIQAIAERTAVDQHGAKQDPQVAAVRASAARIEMFEAAERAAADIERVKERFTADRAAHDTRREDITSGRLVPDGKGGHTRHQPAPPSADETRRRQRERAALRAQPQADIEQQYLAAVADGSNPRLVTLVDTAPESLPLVRQFTRDRASQLRLQHSPAEAHVAQTQQALELRNIAIGHTERAIAEFIAKATAGDRTR